MRFLVLLLAACAPKAPPPAPAPPPVAEVPAPPSVEEPAPPPPPAPPPQPFLTEPMVEGWMDRGTVLSVVQKVLPQVHACYASGLRDRPGLAGQLEMKFTIGQGGMVTYSDIARSTLNDPDVEVCIAQIFGLMRFPAPRESGIVIVRYPFTFSPDAP